MINAFAGLGARPMPTFGPSPVIRPVQMPMQPPIWGSPRLGQPGGMGPQMPMPRPMPQMPMPVQAPIARPIGGVNAFSRL